MMRKKGKLIQLIKVWPSGAVLTSEWLIQVMKYPRGLLQQYRRSGWLELVGKGAYRRVELDKNGGLSPLRWHGGVYALQVLTTQSEAVRYPQIHVAARTALELLGYAHFLKLSGRETVWLFAERNYRIPNWFKNYDWGAQIRFSSAKLFTKSLPKTITVKDWGPYVTQLSCPERAIMELLELCPKYESLENAKLTMEGLASLRPKVASELLQDCTSIKVKRLFLALADICNHEWLREIDVSKIDLGEGARILEPHQSYHKKFQISIPKEGNT